MWIGLYLELYSSNDPLLEYVLLIGDVNVDNFSIPAFHIQSYNENELDITDHPYTYFDNDPLTKEEIEKQEEAEIREKQYRGL